MILGREDQVPAASKELAQRFTGRWPVVIIEATDTGTGIPSKDLPRVFERFYKADRARGRSGTGLGLSIARHLVQRHKGHIWVHSTVGEGSSFFFTLPVANQLDNNDVG